VRSRVPPRPEWASRPSSARTTTSAPPCRKRCGPSDVARGGGFDGEDLGPFEDRHAAPLERVGEATHESRRSIAAQCGVNVAPRTPFAPSTLVASPASSHRRSSSPRPNARASSISFVERCTWAAERQPRWCRPSRSGSRSRPRPPPRPPRRHSPAWRGAWPWRHRGRAGARCAHQTRRTAPSTTRRCAPRRRSRRPLSPRPRLAASGPPRGVSERSRGR